jgi:hypothetical protein
MAILGSGIYNTFNHAWGDYSQMPFWNAYFAMLETENSASELNISINSGVTFTNYNFESKLHSGALITSFDFDGQYVVISTRDSSPVNAKLYISSNYGLTFIDITSNIPNLNNTFEISDVIIKEGRINVSYYSTAVGYTICYSDNYGSSFNSMTGWFALKSSLYFPTKRTGAALFKSSNGNKIIYINEESINDFIDPTGLGLADVAQRKWSMSIPPGTNDTIYTAFFYPTNSDYYINKSSDTGGTWTNQKQIVGSFSESAIIGAVSETKILIEYNGTIYISTDSGANFSSASTFESTYMIFNSSLIGAMGAVSPATNMYYTLDGGSTWNASTGTGGAKQAAIIRRKNK